VFKAVAGVALWRPCALKWSKRNWFDLTYWSKIRTYNTQDW